jgi:hypothetical protein
MGHREEVLNVRESKGIVNTSMETAETVPGKAA